MNACPKCGDATVLLRWHRDGLDCKRYRAFDSRDPVEETEHLHYHCRTCQYDWIGHIRAGARGES